jgi:hypothetical protein
MQPATVTGALEQLADDLLGRAERRLDRVSPLLLAAGLERELRDGQALYDLVVQLERAPPTLFQRRPDVQPQLQLVDHDRRQVAERRQLRFSHQIRSWSTMLMIEIGTSKNRAARAVMRSNDPSGGVSITS